MPGTVVRYWMVASHVTSDWNLGPDAPRWMLCIGGRDAKWAQVLRNPEGARRGRMWSKAGSGPRLNASIRMQMSSASSFAYSITMSKYRSSSKTPVSSSSHLEGRAWIAGPFSSTSRSYGKAL